MYSAEEAAQLLGLQVRTVRNYVREGLLPGVRIGKQYRIARGDLEAFTTGGLARGEGAVSERLELEAPTQNQPSAEVSSVVQIDGIGPAAAARLERTLIAAALSAEREGSSLRVEPIYDEGRSRLKLIVVGAVGGTAEILRVVELFRPDAA
jgi:excisionase family DNA binding protein